MGIAQLSGNIVLLNGIETRIDIRRFEDAETHNKNVNEELLMKFFNFEKILGSSGDVLNCVRESGSKTSAHYPDADDGAMAVDYRNLCVPLSTQLFIAKNEIEFAGVGLYISRQPHQLPFIHLDTKIDLDRRGRPPLYWYRDNDKNKYFYFKNGCKCWDAYVKLYNKEIEKYI